MLRTKGPGCEALHDALAVSLLLLLDEEPERPAGPKPPPRSASFPQPGTSTRSAGFGELWLGAGGALTHGLPEALSFALFGELSLRLPRWELGITGFWAPEREISLEPGRILLRARGGRARGCLALYRSDALRLNGCALFMLAELEAGGRGFTRELTTRQAWWLLGGGPELRWFPRSRFGLGVSGALLASPRQEFYVQGIEDAHETDALLMWFGADASVLIW